MAEQSRLDKVIALARHRGFVFQAGEIYGGSRSAWDYGPLGTELKENIRRQWWQTFVRGRGDMVGPRLVDHPARSACGRHPVTSRRSPTRSWSACSCHKRLRADNLIEDFEARKGRPAENGLADIPCPNCGTKGQYTEPKAFSGLVKTYLGVVDDESGLHFLRPETAQGIFVNFSNVLTASPQEAAVRHRPGRQGVPQRDHARATSSSARASSSRWRSSSSRRPPRRTSGSSTGSRRAGTGSSTSASTPANMRRFDVPEEDRAHYSAGTIDVEYRFGFPGKEWGELMGIANRTDYDLSSHTEASGQSLTYFDQATGEKYIPYVIEPSFGLTRAMMAFLVDAYHEEEVPNAKGGTDSRTVLEARPAARAGQGRRAAAVAQRAALAARARGRRRPARHGGTSTSTTPARSAAATAARTRSARRSASRSTSTRSTTTP